MASDEQTPLMAGKHREKAPHMPGKHRGMIKLDDLVENWWVRFVLPATVLFVVGTLVFNHYEGWPILTSAYVVTQVFTTVGYGDFTVTQGPVKLFVALWALLLLTFAAYAIGMLADIAMKVEETALKRHMEKMEMSTTGETNEGEAMDHYGNVNKLVAGMTPALLFLIFGTAFYRMAEHCTCGVESNPGCKEDSFDTCAATGGYVKSLNDAFYMSVVTLTTVGFGDYQPRTNLGRLISIPWMFIGAFIFANGISSIAAYFYESKKTTKMMAAEATTSIDKTVFNKIDRDGNGYLDRAEFLAYSLLKYDMADEEFINSIFREFEKFDHKGAGEQGVTHAMIAERGRMLLDATGSPRSNKASPRSNASNGPVSPKASPRSNTDDVASPA